VTEVEINIKEWRRHSTSFSVDCAAASDFLIVLAKST